MASKRRQRRKQCEGKVGHPTQAAALDHAYGLARREKGRPLNAYHCGFCHLWHLGHPPAKVRQGIAARRRAAKV